MDEVTKISQQIKRPPVQVALNWMLRKGVNPLIGAKTVSQLQDNLGALEFVLTNEQMAALNAVSKPKAVPFGASVGALNPRTTAMLVGGGFKIELPSHLKSVL